MSIEFGILFFAIVIVLVFDLINGFHDAANSIATVVSTQVLRPGTAVLWAAFFNFIAMFILPPKVADTVSKIVKIGLSDFLYLYVVLIGVLSAIFWSLLTWWFGLPISSSHALIGGIAGAGVAHAGWQALEWEKFILTISFIVIAPLIGFILGSFFMLVIYWMFRSWRPSAVDQLFRKGQLLSAAMYSIGHGANDAQKMMGIIMALLLAAGQITPDVSLSLRDPRTAWIILSCQTAMGLGTALGGWRIVKTMGIKITKLEPPGGFCAEAAGAITLFFASYLGIPVSTTHTIVGSIVGVGTMNHKLSNIRWNIALSVFWAWILTIPLTAGLAALLFRTGMALSLFSNHLFFAS
jgi:PiT family inorganic phosphate transporter